jgi:hypothetical protein
MHVVLFIFSKFKKAFKSFFFSSTVDCRVGGKVGPLSEGLRPSDLEDSM